VLTTKEAADLLGVAVRTVQLWVESGVLRAWKTAGGHRRIARDSVEALLASRARAIADPALEVAREAKTAGPFRVLVVEDDPALRLLFELTLTSWDLPIEVDLADNGFAALLRIGEQRPDLLITDLNMPGMDGFSMLRHLRQSEQWRDLPVIAVSALGAADVAARGGLPADVRLFGKPVPFAEIEQLIRSAMSGRPGNV
jgi:excisionase family DNA binding protein